MHVLIDNNNNNNWLPSDANVREYYETRAIQTSTNIRAASMANGNPILEAELAVMARNEAVIDERRRTSPLGLIFGPLKKPRTMPFVYFRDKNANRHRPRLLKKAKNQPKWRCPPPLI